MAWTCTGGDHIGVDLFTFDAPAEPPRPIPVKPAPELRERKFETLQVNTAAALDALYATAPTSDGIHFLDSTGEVRGDWVRTDLIAESTTHLFVGVLPREPGSALRTAAQRASEGAIQFGVVGRLLLATTHSIAGPPPWDEIRAALG
ncbi:hypothetical protein [Amycolatopsis jiangsuensis]|uniref:Uncharacterized protein n=1 Tax=Amycolatopsis jiangsuensis TaxID=1181879 RepID=A0A840J0T4_9PSEU|nr:hypothetical protein [Amycolatopsis jiangsuensis]MBB4687690.1 hypothetical protein [Amycolatopsis jiangsuensis]